MIDYWDTLGKGLFCPGSSTPDGKREGKEEGGGRDSMAAVCVRFKEGMVDKAKVVDKSALGL